MAEARREVILLNSKAICQLIRCTICRGRLRHPKSLPCLHTYCGDPCLESLRTAGFRACPYCKASFNDSDVKSNPFLDNFVKLVSKSRRREKVCIQCNKKIRIDRLCPHCGDKFCQKCWVAHSDETKGDLERHNNQFFRAIDFEDYNLTDEELINKKMLLKFSESLRVSSLLAQSYIDKWVEVTQQGPGLLVGELTGELRGIENEMLKLGQKFGLKMDLTTTHTDASKKPWKRLHVMYEEFSANLIFLIVLDLETQWPEISLTSGVAPSLTVQYLIDLFSCYGVPETIVTSEDGRILSPSFRQLCRVNQIHYVEQPRRNSSSTTFLNKFRQWVSQTANQHITDDDLQNFLSSYRYSPCPSLPENNSPAELFLGRKFDTTNKLHYITLPEQKKPCDEVSNRPFRQFIPKRGSSVQYPLSSDPRYPLPPNLNLSVSNGDGFYESWNRAPYRKAAYGTSWKPDSRRFNKIKQTDSQNMAY
ncbi:unnamed protein product [Calicophoron daubneyi]|uniref:RING-type domain-containing protein n=1 Tax=Calicophoron daubneyi TaxID=300641 RepID=A0AAV2TWF8_CALDB